MKKYIYIFSVLFLALFSCQEELLVPPIDGETGGDENVTLSYGLNVPEIITRAGTGVLDIDNVQVLTFDENGNYLNRVKANVDPDGKKGKVTVPYNTKIVHFIANYEGWDTWTPAGSLETTIIPAMETGYLGFWGRAEVVSTGFHVYLLRNYAKVTAEVKAGVEFNITGYALGHFATKGKVATFDENFRDNPGAALAAPAAERFAQDPEGTEITTLPSSMSYANFTTNDVCTPDLDEYKYMFESPNSDEDPIFVIIRGHKTGSTKGDRYYKVHLLKSDAQKTHWQIERNYNYTIRILSFEDTDEGGAATYAEACQALPSNNLYAEVVKESPVVSDANGNKLEVDKLVHIFTKEDVLKVQANYFLSGNTTPSNNYISAVKIEGGNFLGTVTVSNGQITAPITGAISGQQTAKINVYETNKNVLSRVITVVYTEKYNFNAVKTITYTGQDERKELSFSIPKEYPKELYPVLCKIETKKMYPVAPNKNMLTEYEGGSSYFVYEAVYDESLEGQDQPQKVYFNTSSTDCNEYIRLFHDYFETEYIHLTKGGTTLYNFEDIKTSISAYGASAVELKFTIPANVTISGEGLVVTISGSTIDTKEVSVSRTGEHTVTLVPNTAYFAGQFAIAASGFNNGIGVISVDSEFPSAKTITGVHLTRFDNPTGSGNGTTNNITTGTLTNIGISNGSVRITERTGDNNNRRYTFVFDSGADMSQPVTLTYTWSSTLYTRKYTSLWALLADCESGSVQLRSDY